MTAKLVFISLFAGLLCSACAVQRPTKADIIGAWHGPGTAKMTFKIDGTVDYTDAPPAVFGNVINIPRTGGIDWSILPDDDGVRIDGGSYAGNAWYYEYPDGTRELHFYVVDSSDRADYVKED
ncbi:MAG TPA: hypothetical protein VG407_12950 [Caulobacteraceae bacterium]|jgi:hypothetical protein|nr:hypothetical protein [Caulobacteraceae bacterium]